MLSRGRWKAMRALEDFALAKSPTEITKMVRAHNVRAGDELSFFNTKTRRENTLVVHAVERRKPDVLLTLKGKRGTERRKRYLQKLSWHGLVRVRRSATAPRKAVSGSEKPAEQVHE